MLKNNVLRSQKDFDAVYRKGKSAGGRHQVVFYRKNGRPVTRVSFIASKKVGNSVARNRARRLLREALRTSGVRLKKGYDVIIIARNSIVDSKMQQVRKSLVSVLRRTGELIDESTQVSQRND